MSYFHCEVKTISKIVPAIVFSPFHASCHFEMSRKTSSTPPSGEMVDYRPKKVFLGKFWSC